MGTAANAALVGSVAVVFVLGIVAALYFRARAPRIYSRIGGLYDDPHATIER